MVAIIHAQTRNECRRPAQQSRRRRRRRGPCVDDKRRVMSTSPSPSRRRVFAQPNAHLPGKTGPFTGSITAPDALRETLAHTLQEYNDFALPFCSLAQSQSLSSRQSFRTTGHAIKFNTHKHPFRKDAARRGWPPRRTNRINSHSAAAVITFGAGAGPRYQNGRARPSKDYNAQAARLQ